MKYLLFVLLVPAVFACVVPLDGMVISDSVEFCTDVYYINKGILISGNDLFVDCNGAVFKSWSNGRGISIENSSNVTVKGCRIVNYYVGFYVQESENVFLNDNHLVKNQVGVRFVNVSDSATFNHDVSLLASFEILDSRNNVLSLTNKKVSGLFCSSNFCNQPRNAVFTFVAPKATEEHMAGWIFSRVGKSPVSLKNLLISGLF